MVVLREILMSSVRAGDPLAAWSAAARLLRSYYPLITPAGQSGLASSLVNSAERLPVGTRCADAALPFIRQETFSLYSTLLSSLFICFQCYAIKQELRELNHSFILVLQLFSFLDIHADFCCPES